MLDKIIPANCTNGTFYIGEFLSTVARTMVAQQSIASVESESRALESEHKAFVDEVS